MKNFLYLMAIVLMFISQTAYAATSLTSDEDTLTLLQEPGKQAQSAPTQTSQLPQMQQGQGEALQLYDIYGVVPTKAAVPYLYIILGVVLVIALCALVVFGYYFMKKRRAKPLPAILPWDQALADLVEARSVQNLAQGRLYMDRVSQILRRYIEQRFTIKTTRKTTSEFLYSLKDESGGELGNFRNELQSCLEQADMAKFAHKVQAAGDLTRMEEAITSFIDSTRPAAGEKEGQK
jgi:hypothetical protein